MEWSVPSIWGGRTGDETFVSLMMSFCQQPKHDDEKADQLALPVRPSANIDVQLLVPWSFRLTAPATARRS
jgi:hypothetical protein